MATVTTKVQEDPLTAQEKRLQALYAKLKKARSPITLTIPLRVPNKARHNQPEPTSSTAPTSSPQTSKGSATVSPVGKPGKGEPAPLHPSRPTSAPSPSTTSKTSAAAPLSTTPQASQLTRSKAAPDGGGKRDAQFPAPSNVSHPGRVRSNQATLDLAKQLWKEAQEAKKQEEQGPKKTFIRRRRRSRPGANTTISPDMHPQIAAVDRQVSAEPSSESISSASVPAPEKRAKTMMGPPKSPEYRPTSTIAQVVFVSTTV
eukprot:m.50748 g.50748  ORF g.50748 m.50748 type:complete len:259 (-) comp11183_c0_seq1:1894-2670(-)